MYINTYIHFCISNTGRLLQQPCGPPVTLLTSKPEVDAHLARESILDFSQKSKLLPKVQNSKEFWTQANGCEGLLAFTTLGGRATPSSCCTRV